MSPEGDALARQLLQLMAALRGLSDPPVDRAAALALDDPTRVRYVTEKLCAIECEARRTADRIFLVHHLPRGDAIGLLDALRSSDARPDASKS